MFDVDDPEEMRKWQGWRKWVTFDALVLFFGITMLVTIIFTVMALNAAELNPEARSALLEGDRDVALPAMADAFAEAASYFDTLFFIFIAIVGFKASVGLFDAFARGQSDMTYYFLPGAKRLKMSHLYGVYLWFVIIFGIIILNFGPADGPDGDPGHPGVPVGVRDGGLLPDAGGGATTSTCRRSSGRTGPSRWSSCWAGSAT